MHQCCEKSDVCGDWNCSVFKPLLYILLFLLYTALFIVILFFFFKFLQSSTGESNSKRSLLCYFLLATMLLGTHYSLLISARMLFFADVWIDFNDVVFDSLAQISNVLLVLTALFLQYQELRILTRMKYSTPVNQRLALIILAGLLFITNTIYLIVAAVLIIQRENAIQHAKNFSDVKEKDNGVWIINSAYNLTNAFIFMIILFTMMVGVRVRRIFLEGEEKRRVSYFFILRPIASILLFLYYLLSKEL